MGIDKLKYSLFFLLLVLLQVWVFNRIHLFGVATPLFYIYFILKLPIDMGRNWLLLISYLLGFVVDAFGYTLGINMLACTILGFSRHYLIGFFAPRDMVNSYVPSADTFGMSLFIRYASLSVLIHHIVFFITESSSLSDPFMIILRILGSSLLTVLLIFGSEQLKFEFLKK